VPVSPAGVSLYMRLRGVAWSGPGSSQRPSIQPMPSSRSSTPKTVGPRCALKPHCPAAAPCATVFAKAVNSWAIAATSARRVLLVHGSLTC
jgi:hypothetical protein